MPKKTEVKAADKEAFKEALKAKYKDVKIMVVPSSLITGVLKDVYTHVATASGATALSTLRSTIRRNLSSMLRCEAECDTNFKQVIPYVVIRTRNPYNDNMLYFCTHRIGGDARLVGGYSIGTGGHIDEGEDIYNSMYRELEEEVGLTDEHIDSCAFKGYIHSTATEVDSVHLGMVFVCDIDTVNISCKEKDKLEGSWVNSDELAKLFADEQLESWSKIVYANVIQKGLA